MPESIEDQDSKPFDLQRYLSIARRRHLHFLVPFLLGWLLVWGASWILPVRYKSGTLILVEEPTVPKNYVTPNVTDNLQGRLQSITQQILSRTRLLLIIDRLNLYSGGRMRLTPDEKVARMRKDIEIELVRNEQDQAITAFRIFYSARDPHIAQQVTTELTQLFIHGNLAARQQESEGTTKFIENQLQNASVGLAAQEAKIREFKGEHPGELPTQQVSNLQILSGLQSQLQSEQDALNAAKQQQVYLQTLIDQYRAIDGAGNTGAPVPAGLTAINLQLHQLKTKLADLSTRYTDSYPDIQVLKSEIAKTEKARSALIANAKNNPSAGAQPEDAADLRDPADPSKSSPTLQLQGQLQAARSEIANRTRSIASLEAKINDYQGRLNAEPVREQQLDDLTRGYAQSKANYDDLLKKDSESQMATSMEQTQQGERFSILDPPSLPVKPDFPNRLKFCGMGAGFGLALGVLVAGGFEFMDDRLHSEKEIKDMLPVAVISEIPEVSLPSDERRQRRKMVLGWAVAALVLAVLLAGTAFSYLHA